ncbi:hypothetical protein Ccrd_002161 [Cynara cardunculus var. scolymus]|uniref:Uncharacterized protein n=1 Tax=Cynara cardunculus var. scolymus TaxID=59895 RepID=A0A103XRX9_CYNCS|nr:hypothetical protein Ccrd_002161 [Cynara cardunculus var. scolymus]
MGVHQKEPSWLYGPRMHRPVILPLFGERGFRSSPNALPSTLGTMKPRPSPKPHGPAPNLERASQILQPSNPTNLGSITVQPS